MLTAEHALPSASTLRSDRHLKRKLRELCQTDNSTNFYYIARVYVVPNISITGEFTGFKIPDSIDSRYNAHYVDFDLFGTVNFTNNVGAKVGFRSVDVGYLIKSDTGALTLKGIYFGAVLRY